MACGFVVAAGVLVLGGVAAQHFAAGLADAQVYPGAVGFKALFASEGWIVGFWN
jgi:hypothetical protein